MPPLHGGESEASPMQLVAQTILAIVVMLSLGECVATMPPLVVANTVILTVGG